MKRLRALVTLAMLLTVVPATAMAGETASPCPAGSTWVDMDDPRRHPAALDRAALGSYDANGDAQTCVRLAVDARAGNLRVAYKVVEPGEVKAAGAFASCPDDSGPVDMNKPDTMPVPLTREILASYDRNGDGQLCLARPLFGEGDFTIDVSVVDMPVFGYWCGGRLATIIGTPQDDEIHGTPGDDVIAGLDGYDQLYGEGAAISSAAILATILS
jgi:RTX calcium-binding nonapeptide repeat (4 copies)